MATKKAVLALAKAQGAEVDIEIEDGKVACVSIWLPDGFIWDNGHGSGIVMQEKYDGESYSQFWDELFGYINASVIKEAKR